MVIALLLHSGRSCATITDNSDKTLRVLFNLPVGPKAPALRTWLEVAAITQDKSSYSGWGGGVTTYNEKESPSWRMSLGFRKSQEQ